AHPGGPALDGARLGWRARPPERPAATVRAGAGDDAGAAPGLSLLLLSGRRRSGGECAAWSGPGLPGNMSRPERGRSPEAAGCRPAAIAPLLLSGARAVLRGRGAWAGVRAPRRFRGA